MNSKVEQVQVFYEIAISIGNCLEADKMLRVALGNYLRKLNLSAGCIFKLNENNQNNLNLELFFSLPKIVKMNKAYQFAQEIIPEDFDLEELRSFKQKLPFSIHPAEHQHIHIVDLPDFGILVLQKNGDDLDCQTINSLIPINRKLSNSIRACLQQKTLQENEKKLAEAHTKLKSLDEEKMIFLMKLTHEMNTPLNWLGASELIDRDEFSEENREFMDMVDRGITRLNNLVQSAISYFDLARSNIKLDPSEVSLPNLISEILQNKKENIDNKKLRVITDFQSPYTTSTDLVFFKEVLRIIIDNAISFSEPSSQIEIFNRRKKGGMTLNIKDYGRGIDVKDITQIFKPFTIEEFKRGIGGTGLSIPKANVICNLLGFTLTAMSKGTGHGAEFIIKMN